MNRDNLERWVFLALCYVALAVAAYQAGLDRGLDRRDGCDNVVYGGGNEGAR